MSARHFAYLDSLRRCGITNVAYAIAPHMMLKFGLSREAANEVIGQWARTANERRVCTCQSKSTTDHRLDCPQVLRQAVARG